MGPPLAVGPRTAGLREERKRGTQHAGHAQLATTTDVPRSVVSDPCDVKDADEIEGIESMKCAS